MSEEPQFTNRLARAKSPYLLQHAHNPVDWYPWGEEAFAASREQNKPIFLSIGYATCHWCHVMERESFEDVDIAKLLNSTFINIKVDREELPEVDSLYMEFAQSMMSGAAGWPLNVILTPDLKPFFATTYLPPHSNQQMMGLADLVERIQEVWGGEEHERVVEQASKIVQVFAEGIQTTGEELPDRELVEDTAELLFRMSDPIHGGMKGAPKFPIGYQSNFLLHEYTTESEGRALFVVERTLDMMQRGGIYDHLGGGFSRYSVDENWLVPHFEKMLYDNALLIFSYLETWQITKKPLFRSVCEETLGYLIRDMRHPLGGFYSAEDADSEGHEGYFYTWRLDEIKNILGNEESALFCAYYGVSSEGNFHGRNILHITQRLEEFAQARGLDPGELSDKLNLQRKLLWKVREQRPHPFKDDKILCSWNGLLLFSMAQTARAFGDSAIYEKAIETARFIKKHMWQDNSLLRCWREGAPFNEAGLEDYAFMIHGLLALFETDGGSEWLEWAIEMVEILRERFKAENGAFYQTDGRDPNLILRKVQFSDGAEPSGNAVHCENLLRLYALTLDPQYLIDAEDVLRTAHKFIDNYAPGYCYHVMNLARYYDKQARTFVVALNEQETHLEALRQLLYTTFIPHRSVIWRRENDSVLLEEIPFMKEQKPIEGKTTLYICQKGVCQKPLTDLAEMTSALSIF
ncbi:MAG: thioredoxin domain-containing protein [Parachlamydia sp.]|nr:thioredoxin domain-containing protein [Parachlamydia sp.]